MNSFSFSLDKKKHQSLSLKNHWTTRLIKRFFLLLINQQVVDSRGEENLQYLFEGINLKKERRFYPISIKLLPHHLFKSDEKSTDNSINI